MRNVTVRPAASVLLETPGLSVGRRKERARHVVRYRIGGRESPLLFGGSFWTQREAKLRRDWIAGELAHLRVPDLSLLERMQTAAPTLRTVAEQWKASRVEVSEATRVLHRVALDRVLPILGDRTIDTLAGDDVARLIEELSAAGKKRETIRKSVKYLAAVLDFAGVEPNPARDKQRLRLPDEELEEMNPPTAAHVEAVNRLLVPAYELPLLWLDWSGARVASIDTLRVSDYDERDSRIRLRASTTKTRQALLGSTCPTSSRTRSRHPWGHARTVTATRGLFPDVSRRPTTHRDSTRL